MYKNNKKYVYNKYYIHKNIKIIKYIYKINI